MSATRARPWRLVRIRSVPRPGRRVIVAVIAVLALGLGAWLWFRDSSLVSVKRVTITGVSGPDAARIRAALQRSARNMTTLDVKMDQLNTAVGPYPVVKKLQVSTQFPHGMRIRVVEEIPVADVQVGGRTVAVAGDGTLLHDAGATPQLPVIELGASPGGTRLTQRDGLPIVSLLAAAPVSAAPAHQPGQHDRRSRSRGPAARRPKPVLRGLRAACGQVDLSDRCARQLRFGGGPVHRRHRPGPARRRGERVVDDGLGERFIHRFRRRPEPGDGDE